MNNAILLIFFGDTLKFRDREDGIGWRASYCFAYYS